MARKEVTQTAQQSDKKLRTKDLIYAGAFGAVYIVLMLIVVLGTSAIPVLYIHAPFTVGVACALAAEFIIMAGQYKSRKMFLLSFLAFKKNMQGFSVIQLPRGIAPFLSTNENKCLQNTCLA